MSNYRENMARAAGVGGGLLAAADDVVRGDFFEGLVEGAGFGILGYIAVHALGYFADWISGDEKSAKKSQSNDAIYKKLTA